MKLKTKPEGWVTAWEDVEARIYVYEYILQQNGIPSRFEKPRSGKSKLTKLLVREEQLHPAIALVLRARNGPGDPVPAPGELDRWMSEAKGRLKLRRAPAELLKNEAEKASELLASVSAMETGTLAPASGLVFETGRAPTEKTTFLSTLGTTGAWLLIMAGRLLTALIGIVVSGGAMTNKFSLKQWVMLGAIALALSPAIVLGLWLDMRRAAATGRRRDRYARQVIQAIRSGSPPPRYALYLRPFSFDGSVQTPNPQYSNSPVSFSHYFEDPYADLEQLFAGALWPELPLVGLGRPSDTAAAGKAEVSDAEWRAIADGLIRHSLMIVMVPAITTSTAWEALQLKRAGAVQKTVFVAPGKQGQAGWSRIHELYRQVGIQFPERLEKAELTLLIMDRDGGLRLEAPMSEVSRADLREELVAFERLLAGEGRAAG